MGIGQFTCHKWRFILNTKLMQFTLTQFRISHSYMRSLSLRVTPERKPLDENGLIGGSLHYRKLFLFVMAHDERKSYAKKNAEEKV